MSKLPEVIEAVHVRTAKRYVTARAKHANRGDGRMVFGLGGFVTWRGDFDR